MKKQIAQLNSLDNLFAIHFNFLNGFESKKQVMINMNLWFHNLQGNGEKEERRGRGVTRRERERERREWEEEIRREKLADIWWGVKRGEKKKGMRKERILNFTFTVREERVGSFISF